MRSADGPGRRSRPADRLDPGRLAQHRRDRRRRGTAGPGPRPPGRSRPGPIPPGRAPRALEGGRQRAAGPGRAGTRRGRRPAPAGHRHIPLGPYRLVVVPSIRGRAAGQVAIQGMANKQIELTTPSFRTTGSAGKPIVAVWIYRDNSLVITHLDFKGGETLRPLARPPSPPAQVRRPRRAPPRARRPRPGAPRPARRRPVEAVPAAEDGVSRRPPEGSSIRDCDPRRDDLKAFWIGLRSSIAAASASPHR